MQFAFAILVSLFLGRWLDEQLGTEPWLLIAGVFIGAAAGFYSMYRKLVVEPQAPKTTGRREEERER